MEKLFMFLLLQFGIIIAAIGVFTITANIMNAHDTLVVLVGFILNLVIFVSGIIISYKLWKFYFDSNNNTGSGAAV